MKIASWKTSLFGAAGIATALGPFFDSLGTALNAMTDTNPATIPNWVPVLQALTAVFTGAGLMHARDDKVTSEQVMGARTTPSITTTLGLLVACMLVCSGCAINRPHLKETITANGTNTVRELRLTTWALWPATQEISKQRGSIGKTLSAGTDNASQESTGGTNGVEALRVISDILGKVRP